jgi:DNA-binding transcriptional MerR regulator
VAKLEFVKLAKLLGLTLGEIAELVGVAEECNEGQIFPHIEELLAQKIAETERKIAELSAFREGLLYSSTIQLWTVCRWYEGSVVRRGPDRLSRVGA